MAAQKHALFFVPNYEANAGGDTSPHTYLALGAANALNTHLTTARDRGDDLLALAGLTVGTTAFFTDDGRVSQTAAGDPGIAQHTLGGTQLTSAGTTYHRHDGDPSSASQTSSDGRAALTTQLMGDGNGVTARGGWRDHTDGNRVLTVRGDKVDIVMGNYKRVIFGRVAGPKVDKSFWEVSGGHIYEGTSTGVSELKSIEWVQETGIDGRTNWKVVEETERGDTFVRYSGRVEEHYNGPSMTSTIGADESSSDKNPHVKSVSWIDTFDNDTAADSITEDTTVDTIDEVTDGRAADLDAKLHCLNAWETVGYKGGSPVADFNDQLWTDDQDNLEVALAKLEFEVGGLSMSTAGNTVALTAGVFFEASALVAEIDFYMGTKTGIRIGPSVAFFTGNQAEINIVGDLDIHLWVTKLHATKKKCRLMGVKCEGSRVHMSPARARLFGFRNAT
jgi:hypothetical protein